MFLNVWKQTDHITHVRISQKVKGVLMWNLQHIIFIWRYRYSKIFKSALVYLWQYKMNEIVNKFLLAGDKFILEMHLEQSGFTYSACGPFTKNKERIQKFKETGDTNYITNMN